MTREKTNIKKKKCQHGYIYFGAVGGLYFFIRADADLKDLNLGLKDKYTQIPSYLCKNDLGFNTGSGQAFEDVFYKLCKESGADIYKVEPVKNGVDFFLNYRPYQLKYGRSAKEVFEKLFEKGDYKYPGQIIITNKENEAELRELIRLNLHRFRGEKVIVNPKELPKISKKEVHDQLHRGFASIKIDAKDIITNSTAQKNIALGIIVSFCAVIGIGAISEYQSKNDTTRDDSKPQRIKEAVEISIKKHWKKGVITSTVTALIIFCGHIIHRQMLRPK